MTSSRAIQVALIGDHNPTIIAHQAIPLALQRAAQECDQAVEFTWAAIRFTRETGRPFLGTCGGFQHALLEHAQNVLGLKAAAHAETDPEAAMPLISLLSCSLVEKSDDILLAPDSRIARIFGATTISEGYRCRYGLNPYYESLFTGTPMRICGRDRAGEVRAMELISHPFFFITLFQHERRALRNESNLLVNAFVGAAASSALNAGMT